ncbi:type II secretory pathway, ATPase PulE/Tfp pilus assembly pathway, ATPase PilB [Caulobacter sp. AP07]|uniref:GspE/PulE family protein n=1 Tax=Caulobacter sp. AP07 TaxID=1144304 RepID=UPI000271F73B|nr:GspE/PulE family protein [Caulobacter sp. AP07]EJL35646.1 type II secretory pathway, ATPase PulE/Tfp pilus assembly pathway, ATPase PilB [Caulobacter sp. AP07]
MTPARGPSRSQARARLVEDLIDRGLVEMAAIARAELVALRTGQPVEQVLNQLGVLSDDDLTRAYAQAAGCEIWEPRLRPVAAKAPDLGVTVDFLRRARLLPLGEAGPAVLCAACDPLDDEALAGLVFAANRPVSVLAARPGDWRRAFEERYGAEAAAPSEALDERRLAREIDQVSDGAVEGSGARLVAEAFEEAIALGASDIHFEPRRHDLRVRLRVDGRMIDYRVVAADLAAPAVSRIKVIANLNLGERRLPQDGRTSFVIAGKSVDVRVATAPTVFGEAAVLRILDRSAVPLELGGLGLAEGVTEVLRKAGRAPHGIFLVTGPTGSGKTTTLYALLETFTGSPKKVLSVEDPVEYHFEHVSQTQVAPALGLTFAAALRSFLRQDPDIILVGEIRDPETAAVAIQAAMTGHLVLASIHANDALAVLPRLLDMGVEPYQLAAAFRGAVAQRLVRRLCPHCREAGSPTKAELAFVAGQGLAAPLRTFRAVGCPACKGVGFKGRAPIAEAFLTDEALLRAIADRQGAAEIGLLARQLGLTSMAADGLDKAVRGETTLEEVMGAVHD